MSLEDYWQENKRFLGLVGGGLALFVVASALLSSFYESDIAAAESKVRRLKSELARPTFSTGDRDRARDQNEALRSAVERLAQATAFVPRAPFRLDPELGSAPNQYLRALAGVREDLLVRANRANLALDPGLGLPRLSPTRDAEIERYLEALDAIDTLVRHAIASRVRRVEKIQIRLDPGLLSRSGLGDVERTRVELTLTGDSGSLTSFLGRTQRPGDGRVLHLESIELIPSRNKENEVRLDATVVLARLAGAAADEAEGERS